MPKYIRFKVISLIANELSAVTTHRLILQVMATFLNLIRHLIWCALEQEIPASQCVEAIEINRHNVAVLDNFKTKATLIWKENWFLIHN